MSYLFLEYPKCNTCRNAKKWLDEHKITYEDRHIIDRNPSVEELTEWIKRSKLPLKNFFNISGLVYKEMKLKDKLPAMSEAEQIALLASDGKLIKRPLLISEDRFQSGRMEQPGKIMKTPATQPIEQHPLGFFLPENTKLLMLGSFPPPRARWSMNFYYPNIQNDMWRILGLVFYNDKEYFLETKKAFSEEKAKAFCREKGIGIGDTAMEIIRLKNNASDNFLQVVTPLNPVEVLAKIPECEAIVVTGQKAMDTLIATLPPVEEPKVGSYSRFTLSSRIFHLYRMPSSSRAYPKPLEEKAAVYKQMFEDLKMI